jgi:UDP-N-acetylmuramyl-tripeptide synthetase
MRLTQLINALGDFKLYSDAGDFKVRGISCNSKNIGEDFIFIAVKGTKADGNKFIQEALSKGAKAVIFEARQSTVQRKEKVTWISVLDSRIALAKLAALFYGNPSSKMRVTGITGTNGKTTTAYLIEAILKKINFVPGVVGTINYRFKDKVFPSTNTTPGPIELQSILAQMFKEGVDYCVMEASSHGLDQSRTEGINFSSAIFTNLTQDHLDYHKTLEKYFKAKALLFKNLKKTSFAVINCDDEYARKIKKITRAKIITYGIQSQADINAKDIKMEISHTQFAVCSTNYKALFKTRLIGIHNVYNMLAAFAWAKQEGLDLEAVKQALEDFSFVPGRLERIESNRDFSVFVDYAHTEDALKNVLNSLRQISTKKIIVVFGCGGERDKTKRPKMGCVVSTLADFAIITNDNPRCEDPDEIISDIKKGINNDNFCVIPERFEAIRKSLSLAKSGDVVLVAGKGHENYQIFKDKVIHFDDCEVVRQCLKLPSY